MALARLTPIRVFPWTRIWHSRMPSSFNILGAIGGAWTPTPAGAGRMTTVMPPFRARVSRGIVLGFFGAGNPDPFISHFFSFVCVSQQILC